jgi:nicotinate-nucleotide pyrophosphorylase (carboxylating)
MLMRPDQKAIEAIVRMALMEDAPWGDITSQSLLPADARISAQLVARENGILCGEDIFAAAMRMTGTIVIQFAVHDGEQFARGEVLATVDGQAQTVLQAERVALNFIQRLSGIATLTAQYVAETAGTKARIVDTRKTTPGLRLLERYAVRCGGGHNHRFSLSDAVMAKDNHLAVLTRHGKGNLTDQLRSAFARLPHTTHVEVEVDHPEQIEAILASGVGTIMLDNFTIEELRADVQQIAGRARVEASGRVRLDDVREISSTGVDIISVGALTHSARSLDLGLDYLP